ncbi:MAG: dTMP kinase [Candidatus Omnitrophica bacterium]|nr:dTMP kinase [Candidatus Omnitrophota bacterium]
MKNKRILSKGIFIAFEGPEGCGKSTQSKRLYAELCKNGYDVLHTSEPGDTGLGKKIREILLYKKSINVTRVAELLLFEADRAQHVADVILPALDKRKIVLCDRFNTATFAYQGYGLGLPLSSIRTVDDIARQSISPDIVICLDVDVKTGLKRAMSKNMFDKMEKRGFEFHSRVRKGYIQMAKTSPRMFRVVNAAMGKEEVYCAVRKIVYGIIEKYTRPAKGR